MAEPVLEAEGVVKRFSASVMALAGIDLSVERGETVALIGESGCGKTTLLRLFNALEIPTSGEIRVFGTSTSDHDPITLRRSLGYVQQEGGLLPHWNVERNVGLVPELLGWEAPRRRQRSDELLDLVGLSPGRFRERFPHELSGGQRQRVAFARALAAEPAVILLDEPFGALDALTRLDLHEEFLSLKASVDKTMVLVTHDLAEAFLLGDRIAVLKEGRILQVDTPENLRSSPAPGYVQRLVGRVREDGAA